VGLTIRKEKRNIIVQSWGIIITYRPGGAIDIKVEYRPSTSDMTLLRRLLGVQMFIRGGRAWIEALDPANPEQKRTGFYPIKTKFLEPPTARYRRRVYTATLRPVACENGYPKYNKYSYTMDNIVYPKRRAIDRKGAAAVRARYKPFLTLLSGYLKMTADQELPKDAGRADGRDVITFFKANKVKLRGDKHLDKQMDLIQLMCLNRIEYFHYRNSNGGYNYGRKVNAAGVLADARKMLHDAHPAEAYVTTTVNDGSTFRARH